MKRLTKRDENGNAYYDFGFLNANHWSRGKHVDRLAAYEDTDLTPSDIADLRNELCLKCGRFKLAHEGACDGCRFRKE